MNLRSQVFSGFPIKCCLECTLLLQCIHMSNVANSVFAVAMLIKVFGIITTWQSHSTCMIILTRSWVMVTTMMFVWCTRFCNQQDKIDYILQVGTIITHNPHLTFISKLYGDSIVGMLDTISHIVMGPHGIRSWLTGTYMSHSTVFTG